MCQFLGGCQGSLDHDQPIAQIHGMIRLEVLVIRAQRNGSPPSKRLHRLGFTGRNSGLATRPLMSRQSETVDAIFQYLQVQPNKEKLRQSVEQFNTFGDITIVPIHETGPVERHRKYKRIYKARCQPAGS
jgi:hypothetical protein